ncbi:MAG: hypothetical protein ACK5ZB_00960 [bacterium]
MPWRWSRLAELCHAAILGCTGTHRLFGSDTDEGAAAHCQRHEKAPTHLLGHAAHDVAVGVPFPASAMQRDP